MASGDNDGRLSGDGALDATQGLALPVTPAGGSNPSAPGVSQKFARGDLVAERYKVVRLIGEGGMGEVYEAEDLLLRERVALKTVRTDVAASDPRVVDRFKREIQLARKVTHPNVCRIFDVGLHRPPGASARHDLAFLTMELLEGETLAARLARTGRMTPAEAAPLVTQMAAALEAAHQQGIVHRDFKSANVMLVDGPRGTRAVVTDFGLARGKQAATDPTITGDGGVVGSPSYMAPEQVEGKEITPAADIYALGVVMYEMITGRLPFVGDTPLSTAVKRLREDPETPGAHVAGLDPRWERAILHCLKRDPAQRPASARAVAEAVAPSAPHPRAWLRAAAIGLPLFVALLVAVAFMSRRGSHASVVEAPVAALATADEGTRRAVAVLGFKNLTGRAESDWISGALTEMLATELSAGADLRIISGESVARAKRELALTDEVTYAPDTLARLRKALGADYVLTGSYMAPGRESGGRVRLDLKLVDARTGEVAAVLTQTGAEADLVDLVARTGETLRGRLSLGALSPSEKEAARASQPRGDAARLYAEGLAHLRVAACSAARAPLEQAVATDPTFPLARSALAQALSCLGHDDRALAEARRAVEMSADLPEQIRLATQAQLFRLTRQPEKAIEAYSKLFERFPDNFDYGYELAQFQLSLGRDEDFARSMASLRRLPPPESENPRLDLLEAYADANAGNFVDALSKVQAARARAEQQGLRLVSADGGLVQARIHLLLRQVDEALAVAEKARVIYEAANDLDGISKTLAIEAAVREAQGDLAGVERAEKQVQDIARDLESPRQMWSFKFMLGVRMLSQGRVDTALAAFEDAREIARGESEPIMAANSAFLIATAQSLRGQLKAAEEALATIDPEALPTELRAILHAARASLHAARDEGERSQAELEIAEKLATGAARGQVAMTRISLLNDEKRHAEAARLAREAIERFPGTATGARLLLARALIETGDLAGARAALAAVDKTQYRGEFAGELQVAILRAWVQGASGELAEARRGLAEAAEKADDQGARLLSLLAREVLARLELEKGDAQKGRALMQSVARDAAALGCVRMARQARERLLERSGDR